MVGHAKPSDNYNSRSWTCEAKSTIARELRRIDLGSCAYLEFDRRPTRPSKTPERCVASAKELSRKVQTAQVVRKYLSELDNVRPIWNGCRARRPSGCC